MKLALLAFDHDFTSIHDELCGAGAVEVLMRCLQQIVISNRAHRKEKCQICQLIELTYRGCSPKVTIHSLNSIAAELIILLFSILKVSEAPWKGAYNPVRALLQHIASFELSVSSIKDSDKLLSFLLKMISPEQKKESISQVAMHILAGLTKHRESKLHIMQNHPTLLQKVLTCCQDRVDGPVKLETAKLLHNISVHVSNKALMTQKMIMEQLLDLAETQYATATRIQALMALRNLSVEAKGKIFIATYSGGLAIQCLLRAATDHNLNHIVVDIFLNVACYMTASALGNQEGVIDTIAALANEPDSYLAEKAAQTLKRFSTHISVSHNAHPALFDAILFLSRTTKHSRVKLWMAKAFLEQARLSVSSFVLVRSPEALQQLCKLARNKSVDIQLPAIEALRALCASFSNMKRIATNSAILETLVQVVERSNGGDEKELMVARQAILAILNLIDHRSARRRAAKHAGVVASLSHYGMSSDDDEELKIAALHGVVLLAPLA